MQEMRSNVIVSEPKMDSKKFEFPAGFRFHPTDVELINQYLVKKVDDNSFSAIAIAEVDMNKCEPWDLPGRDKEIYDKNVLIGMKKTLVFYQGRVPSGVKTSWIMQEYRLEGSTLSKDILLKRGMVEWVISKIYKKRGCEKKTYDPRLETFTSFREQPSNTNVYPSMNSSPSTNGEFSYAINSFAIPNQTQDNNIVGNNEANVMNISSSSKQIDDYPFVEATQNHLSSQEQSMTMTQLENENYGSSLKQIQHDFSLERDLDAHISSILYENDMFLTWYGNQELILDSPEPMVTDLLWNY
ncbi:hypothetical protein RYX36_000208 [Vicia faba]